MTTHEVVSVSKRTSALSARGEHTFVPMTHFGLPTEDERTGRQDGWTGALRNLERLFEPRRTP